MNKVNSNQVENEINEKVAIQNNLTKKVATAGILMGVGLILSYLNPFAYFTIMGAKIFPFAHFINALTGVLIGLPFALITALGIAIFRFSFGLGSIHAFHGGISGAIVVGISAYVLRKKYPEKVEFAALTEPIGTVFIGGTIAYLIIPVGGILGLLAWWGLFAVSCIPGCILGFLMLKILRRAGITWEDYF
ncbi:MAG: energy coupling factor transporter S component ThiW [Promethearchaeota archaeon]